MPPRQGQNVCEGAVRILEPGLRAPMYPEDAGIRGDIANMVPESNGNLRFSMTQLGMVQC